MNVFSYIKQQRTAGKKMLAVLLDPAKGSASALPDLSGVDFIFVGGSGLEESIDDFVKELSIINYQLSIPIVLFPGSLQQFTPHADALLFLSLLSGRNAEMLIGSQVRAARVVRESGIETIPMGYILIDGGRLSSVEKASETRAIPASDTDLIVDTALAGEMLGMQCIYLEAGSGACTPVAVDTIRQVRQAISLPLIVGGGICTPEQMQAAFQAGADLVVIGNHFETHPEEIPLFAEVKVRGLES